MINKIKQLFCKHEWWIGRREMKFLNASGDKKVEVCRKCGKIRKEYFIKNIDGS